MNTANRNGSQWPLLIAGGLIIVFGLLLLLDGVEHQVVAYPGQLWPLFLLAVAAVVVGGHEHREELRKGLILLAVGIWFLVNTLGIGGLDYSDSWPLLLILIGLAITVTPRGRRICSGMPGPVLILWGALAWIATRQLWGLSWGTVWPLALVAIGAAIAWNAIAEQLRREPPDEVRDEEEDRNAW